MWWDAFERQKMKIWWLSLFGALLCAEVLGQFSSRIPPKPEEKKYNGSYVLIGPRSLRKGQPYKMTLNVLKQIPAMNIQIFDTSTNRTVASKNMRNLGPGRSIPVSLSTREVVADSSGYQLRAIGQNQFGAVVFDQQQHINVARHSESVFIQTDKAVYKPGNLVRYRVVVVTPDMKPTNGTISIKIKDKKRNVISQKLNQFLNRGVFSGDLQLSDEPPLGDWTIQVQTSAGSKISKTFSVEEYVLPKFEVDVTTVPADRALTTSSVTAKIKAKYTFGKGLEGTARIRAEPAYYRNFFPSPPKRGPAFGPFIGRPGPPRPNAPSPLEKTVELNSNGEAEATFTNAELREQNLVREYGGQLNVSAIVTEKLTGEQRGGFQMVEFFREPLKFEFEKPSQHFKPGIEYKMKVSLKTFDDEPLPQKFRQRTVNVNITYMFNQAPPESVGAVGDKYGNYQRIDNELLTLRRDGTAELKISPPDGSQSVSLNFEYLMDDGTKLRGGEYLSSSESPTDSFLSVDTEQDSVAAGQMVDVRVESTEAIGTVSALVISRGKIRAHVADHRMPGRSGILRLRTTPEMAPTARIVVYRTRPENKEIVADSVQLKLEGTSRNKVRVSVTPPSARPGQRVQVRVKSDPNSFVGLLGVDKSVKLLKSGNDITQEMIEAEIQRYNNPYGFFPGPLFDFRRKKRSVPFWGGSGSNARSIFDSAGLVVLTDSWLYGGDFGFCPHCRGPMPEAVAFGAGPLPAAPPPPGGGAAGFAGPTDQAAFNKAGPGQDSTRVRSVFPETWIWLDEVSRRNGETIYATTAPDTITTWLTSAFAINENTGLGVAAKPAELNVFKNFFVRANLPYSVKRGEELGLQVIVFSYQPRARQATVTLVHDESSGFDFVAKNGARIKPGEGNPGYNVRQVTVGGQGQESADVFFPIVPNAIGQIKLSLVALSGSATDNLDRNLLVEPEGYLVEINKPMAIDLTTARSFQQSISLDVPRDIVPESDRADVSVIGSLLGPALENVQNLVRMPYGCGEQNMVNFVPNIVVLRYLTAISQLTPSLERKAKKFMEAGYQRELNYKRDDGSYSAFGDRDPAGSTWLTAFVLKSFAQAEPYIFIDEKVLKQGLAFLRKQQIRSGAFQENGEVHHQGLLGGSGRYGVPLTAYVLISMLQNQVRNDAALRYLENSLDSISNDPYGLAITTYALHKANSSMKDTALSMLEKLAVEQDGTKHWKDRTAEREHQQDKPSYWYQPATADVEMTGYALLTYMLRNELQGGRSNLQNAMPVVRWLTYQRNPFGGFTSTQDTVIALEGLGMFAELAYSNGLGVTVQVANGPDNHRFTVTPANANVLQQEKIANPKLPISITANGRGLLSAQVSLRYNTRRKRHDEPFDCSPQVAPKSKNALTVSMCCRHKQAGKTKMAVMELNALSGYRIDRDQVQSLTSIPDLQRVELDKGDSKANIYFNSMSPRPTCFNVSSSKSFDVSNPKPAQILLYAYYAPEKRAEMEYSSQNSQSLAASCARCWETVARQRVAGGSGGVQRESRRRPVNGWIWEEGTGWVRQNSGNNRRAHQGSSRWDGGDHFRKKK